jgi:hypothetical protein
MKPGFFLYFSFLLAKLLETGLIATMRNINSGNTPYDEEWGVGSGS